MRGPSGCGGNSAMADIDPETLCLRCGRCCHEKLRIGAVVVLTDVPCAFLDTATKLCRVYADRFNRQPHCATAARSAAVGGMPGDCPYVKDIPDYPAPVLLADHLEYAPAVAAMFPGRSRLAEANVMPSRGRRSRSRRPES